MKKLFLLTKMLLVVAGLGVGMSAWADDYSVTPYYQDYETETNFSQGWKTTNMSSSWATNSGNHYHLLTSGSAGSAYIDFNTNPYFTSSTDYRFSFKMNMNYHTGSKTTTVTVKGVKNNESITLFKIVSKDNVDGYAGTSHVFYANDTEITTFTNGGYGNNATMTPTIPFVITSNSSEGTKLSVNGEDAVSLDAGFVSVTGITVSTGNSSALKVSFDDMKLESSDIYYNKTVYYQNYEDADTYNAGWTTNANGTINQLVARGVTYLEIAHGGGGSGQSGSFTFATASALFASATDYSVEFDFAHSQTHNTGNSSSFTFMTTKDETLFKLTNANNYTSDIVVTNSSETEIGTLTADGYTSSSAYVPSNIHHFAIHSNSTSGTYLVITDKDGVVKVNQKVAEGLVNLKSISYTNARYYRHTIFGNLKLNHKIPLSYVI